MHALYLGKDFSITDQLLAKQDLNPGEEVWLTDVHNGFPYKTIPLQVEDAYLSWGISEITEFIKIFISTEELAVHRFNQEGLQQDTPTSPTRGIGRRKQITGPDWTTREIELIIERPFEEESTGSISDEDVTEPESEPPAPAPTPAPAPKPASSSPVEGGKKKKTITATKLEKIEKIHLPKYSEKDSTTFSAGKSPSVVQRLKNWLSSITKPLLGGDPMDMPPPSQRMDPSKYLEKKEEKASDTDRSIAEQLDKMLEEVPAKPGMPEVLKSKGEQVDCSVYAPPAAQKGDDVFIQVWLHLPDLKEEVKMMALEFDEAAEQRAFQSLKVPLEKGEELSLVLEAKGIELDESVQHIVWNGDYQSAQFVASIPEDFAKKMAIFTLRVFKGEMPIGHIKFILKISAEIVAPIPQPQGIEAKRYKKAFISYSSEDRDEVLKRVQMLKIYEIPLFMDILNLKPGERVGKKSL